MSEDQWNSQGEDFGSNMWKYEEWAISVANKLKYHIHPFSTGKTKQSFYPLWTEQHPHGRKYICWQCSKTCPEDIVKLLDAAHHLFNMRKGPKPS